MTFIYGLLTGISISVVGIFIALYAVQFVEHSEKCYVYYKGRVKHKGNSYQIIGEHPFYDGEIVTGRVEFKKGTAYGNPTIFAKYKIT